MLVSWWPPPGPTPSLRKPPRRRANVLRAVEGTRRAHARDVTAARGGAEIAPRRRAAAPGRRARGECARASAALPGLEPGGRPGARGEREAGAGLRRLSLQRLASRGLRLHCRRLSDRPARVRAAPVGFEALPVGPADPPSLWRGHRGGPARVLASVSAASALPASCFTSPPSSLLSRGLPGGRRTRGHPRPNAFREAVDFRRAVAWVRLSASAGQRARVLRLRLPSLERCGGDTVPVSEVAGAWP